MNANTLHKIAWKSLGKSKCERANCDCTIEDHLALYAQRFDMHNALVPKDYSIIHKAAWMTLCKSCHTTIEKLFLYKGRNKEEVMRLRQEISRRYEDMSDEEVLRLAHEENDTRKDATEKLTEILSHYKLSNRFKNNMKYRNSSFGEFLLHEFQIDEKKQYNVWCSAYMHYPEEAKKIGPTLVVDIKQRCGSTKVPQIVEKIKQKEEETGKVLPLKSNGNHPSIEKIIKPFLRPVPEKPKSTLRNDYKDSQKQLAQTKTVLTDTRKELDEREEQVNKLKKTVIEMKSTETPGDDINEDNLLNYFEKKIGKVFTQEDFDLLKKFY